MNATNKVTTGSGSFFDVSITSRYFNEKHIKHHCHDEIEKELTKNQKIASDILFWARNLNIGKEVCCRFQIFPGPSGFKDTKGRWWPSPLEACDSYNGYTPIYQNSAKSGKRYPDPWSRWKHCKTLQHCQYLVKYRLSFVYNQINCMDKLIYLVHHLDNLPLLINLDEKNNIEAFFAKQALSGLNFNISKKY